MFLSCPPSFFALLGAPSIVSKLELDSYAQACGAPIHTHKHKLESRFEFQIRHPNYKVQF